MHLGLTSPFWFTTKGFFAYFTQKVLDLRYANVLNICIHVVPDPMTHDTPSLNNFCTCYKRMKMQNGHAYNVVFECDRAEQHKKRSDYSRLQSNFVCHVVFEYILRILIAKYKTAYIIPY